MFHKEEKNNTMDNDTVETCVSQKSLTLSGHPLVRPSKQNQKNNELGGSFIDHHSEIESDTVSGELAPETKLSFEANQSEFYANEGAIAKDCSANEIGTLLVSEPILDKSNTFGDIKVNSRNQKQKLSTRSSSKLQDPVIEIDENIVKENELINRNNEIGLNAQRSEVLSDSNTTLTNSMGSRKECKQSLDSDEMTNIVTKELDNTAIKSQSSRRVEKTLETNSHRNQPTNCNNTVGRILESNNTKHGRKNNDLVKVDRIGNKRNERLYNTVEEDNIHKIGSHKLGTCSSLSMKHAKNGGVLFAANEVKKKENVRFKSVFEQRYTKCELTRALPRRSFFSCHDKAIKDAGLETDDPAAKRKAERLKVRLDKIANEFECFMSARTESNEQNNTDQSTTNALPETESITENNNSDVNANDKALEERTLLSAEKNSQEVIEQNPFTSNVNLKVESAKLTAKNSHKKRPLSGKYDHIDCKPLLQYLEYVKDHSDEYLLYLDKHLSHQRTSNDPSTQLISMGKAFELRHRGGIPQESYTVDNILVMASKALRPRTADTSKYSHNERDNKHHSHSSGNLRGHERSSSRPTSEDKRRQHQHPQHHQHDSHGKEDEPPKTELERKKLKAEEWTASVPTNILTKAKIQSLRELGADDFELMKWWEAFSQCRYLRDTGPVEYNFD